MPKTDFGFRQQLGNKGELLACQFLRQKGYRLLRQNYLISGGQIDLIMYSPQGNLVFVEVKTRLISEESVTRRQPQREEIRLGPLKLLALRRTAGHFLKANPFPFATWQLDLIWINLELTARPAPLAKIKHYQNILEI